MLIAKDILSNDVPQELQFLMNIPSVKSKITIIPHQFTSREKKFIDYWRGVRAAIEKIEKIPPNKTDIRQKAIDSFF
jgi:hypothetical protein